MPKEVLARVRVHLRIGETNRAIARENQARLEEFRNAQRAILVRSENCPEASFAVYYKPLEATGGDFYDVVAVDSDVFGYFVADISGHGVSAAFITAAIKALLRQYTGALFLPEDTMRGIDTVMRQNARRRAIPYGVLRAIEPAGGQALGRKRRTSSVDPDTRLGRGANTGNGQ